MTASILAFLASLAAFAVYGLYASAASLRDRAAAHASLGADGGAFPAAGVVVASFAWVGLFALPLAARAEGYPGTAAALVAVSVPMVAAALATRLWATGHILGARGLGELLTRQYGAGVAGLGGLFVTVGAIALVANAFKESAALIEMMSRGMVGSSVALYLMALFVALTAAPAGIRAAASMARVHAALVLFGAAAAILLVIDQAGGVGAVIQMLARVGEARNWGTTGGRGGGDYNAALAVGGIAGSLELLSVHVTLGGAMLALVWLPWARATTDPRRFAGIQIWSGAALGGALTLALAWLVGLTAVPDDTVSRTLARLAGERLWAAAALGLAGAAALHAFALSLVGACVGMLRSLWSTRERMGSRDLAWAQGVAVILIGAALLAALAPSEDLEAASAIALSLAMLLLLPLVSVCWAPRVTGPALIVGLVCGAVVAFFASALVVLLAAAAVTMMVAIARPGDARRAAREEVRRRLAVAFAGAAEERGRVPLAWAAALIWIFFAVGPGVVVGNDIFGAPDLPRMRWDFPLPSIAVWQILSWAAGVVLVWFLAKGVGLSVVTHAQMERLSESPQTDRQSADH